MQELFVIMLNLIPAKVVNLALLFFALLVLFKRKLAP